MRPWVLVSAAWIGPAILAAINQIAQQRLSGETSADARAVLFASLDWLLYAFLTPAVFWISARFPLTRPRFARHAVLHLAMALLFCVLWAGAGTLLKIALQPDKLWGPPHVHFVRWFFITLPFGVAVYLAVVGIEHATRYFVQMTTLSEQLSSAKLTALQARVNPHFLFNTLNTIGVLVREGQRSEATRIIEQFSDVMRRTLRRDRAHEVTLSDELEVVRQYLAIEEARFADRLRTEVQIDDAVLSAAVPSFALQMLVENAVRHGIARSPDGGTLVIRARRDGKMLEMTVIDNGPGAGGDPALAGHSIENTRERLRALYGDRASLVFSEHSPRGTIATMRVPYHEVVMEAGIA
jgi:signal transduction histidine kinase